MERTMPEESQPTRAIKRNKRLVTNVCSILPPVHTRMMPLNDADAYAGAVLKNEIARNMS